jgi:hypothetical protein
MISQSVMAAMMAVFILLSSSNPTLLRKERRMRRGKRLLRLKFNADGRFLDAKGRLPGNP